MDAWWDCSANQSQYHKEANKSCSRFSKYQFNSTKFRNNVIARDRYWCNIQGWAAIREKNSCSQIIRSKNNSWDAFLRVSQRVKKENVMLKPGCDFDHALWVHRWEYTRVVDENRQQINLLQSLIQLIQLVPTETGNWFAEWIDSKVITLDVQVTID